MQNLKIQLLNLNIFNDNVYLDLYCDLININIKTPREKFKTQLHHIVPKCYYVYNNLPTNNSKNNIVNLLYKDHILAHYYLCLCVKNISLKYRLGNAFLHMISKPRLKMHNIEECFVNNLEEKQSIYEYTLKQLSIDLKQKMKGKNTGSRPFWVCNKIKETKALHPRVASENEKMLKSQKMKGRPLSESHIEALKEAHKNESNYIYCIELNKLFECSRDVYEFLGTKTLHNPQLLRALKGEQLTAFGYHWFSFPKDHSLNEYENQISATLNKKPKISKRKSNSRDILCVELDLVFPGVRAAEKYLNELYNNTKKYNACILNVCKGKGDICGGFHWRFKQD